MDTALDIFAYITKVTIHEQSAKRIRLVNDTINVHAIEVIGKNVRFSAVK